MVSKAEGLTHFIGQLILGILQIIAGVGIVLLWNEMFGTLFSGSTYVDMVYLPILAFIIVHGLWRILDNFVRWRNAD